MNGIAKSYINHFIHYDGVGGIQTPIKTMCLAIITL